MCGGGGGLQNGSRGQVRFYKKGTGKVETREDTITFEVVFTWVLNVLNMLGEGTNSFHPLKVGA